MNITIRLAHLDDAPDIAEIHIRSWEAAYKDIVPAEFIQEKNSGRPAQYQRILSAENKTLYLIAVDDKPAGVMGIIQPQENDTDETYHELSMIYLHPDYFRKGIGTKAVNFAFDVAREAGKKFMIVWVFAENHSSIQFYEKCGFIRDNKTKIINYGRAIDAIRMRKDLTR